MPTYEVRGPDRAGKFWVVAIKIEDAVISEIALQRSYGNRALAQTAADKFNNPQQLARK